VSEPNGSKLESMESPNERLLQPEWAGDLNPLELAYVISQLKASRRLKRIWGFRPSAKRIPQRLVVERARNGLPPRRGRF